MWTLLSYYLLLPYPVTFKTYLVAQFVIKARILIEEIGFCSSPPPLVLRQVSPTPEPKVFLRAPLDSA